MKCANETCQKDIRSVTRITIFKAHGEMFDFCTKQCLTDFFKARNNDGD